MMAIAVIGALFLYVWLSFGVVWLVVRWAKKRGRSPIRWGIVAGLVMYHLVFWDFLPTFIVYKYYCTTKAGFWVYKTPEQWKEENPGVAETLTWKERSETFKSPDITLGYNINQRLIWIIRKKSTNLVPVGINEQEIVDLETHEVLAKIIGVSTGHSGEKITRFWTHFGPCFDGSKEFSLLVTKYKQIGREEK